MQVGDTVKEVNGELLDDKTPSEGVWVGVECGWMLMWKMCSCWDVPAHPVSAHSPVSLFLPHSSWPGLASVTISMCCMHWT